MGRYVVSRVKRRMPSPALVSAGRGVFIHYEKIYDSLMAFEWTRAVVPPSQVPIVRSVIRSAAIQLSVSSLYRDALQRAAAWFIVPVSLIVAAAVPLAIGADSRSGLRLLLMILATVSAIALGVATLLVAVARERVRLHFWLTLGLGVIGLAISLSPPASALPIRSASVAFCVTPAAMYTAFIPMVIVAYAVAWRLSRIVDPRARIVLALLQCAHQVSSDTRWLHAAAARDRIAARLERAARIAERDLPHLLTRKNQDANTKAWLKGRARLIGVRMRECKRTLVLPHPQSVEQLPSEILQLLMHATRDDWEEMCAAEAPSRIAGMLRKILPHVAAGLLLILAGAVLPEIVPQLKGMAGENLRTTLLLSGVIAFVPIEGAKLNRIPDAFGDAVKAR
jgi:hypothetical protein